MIEKLQVWITPFQLERTIHVYLPNEYETSDEPYPVMYMYDGHNLFFDEEATYGKSWGLKDFLDQYDKKLIIVGIECNHEGNERLQEFSPYDFKQRRFGSITGKGEQLMDWLITELKPMIDNKYRTMALRECTAIGGSSMGGLMSLYTIMKYNQYFSKAACLSSSIPFCYRDLKKECQKAQIDPDTKVYLSFGTAETNKVDQWLKMTMYFHDYFSKCQADCMVNVVEGGQHSEASWEKENPIYMDFLWK